MAADSAGGILLGPSHWPAAEDTRAQRGWSATLLLILAVLVVRLVYLIWLSPWQLVGDESYYWEQARHLDLCYNEKGPLLAWMIAACCRVFGDTEWAVRLPMVISSAVAAWGVGRLALAVSGGNARVAFWSVATFFLLPAFQWNAHICTQDGPLIALWVALTATGLRLIRRWQEDKNTWLEWLVLWFLLGIGMLLKQSILIFLPSLALYALVQRRELRWHFARLIAQQVVGGVILIAVMTPMIVWNAQHHWPMLAHTLGHIGAGGDQAGHVDKGNLFLWMGSLLGGVIAALGPAAVVLMIWTCRRAVKTRIEDAGRWHDRLWLMCAAWPPMIFFWLLSFKKPVIPSWPLPSFVPLVILIGELAAEELPRYAAMAKAWRADRTIAKKKPETPFHQLWSVLVIYGIAAWLLFSFPMVLAHLPLVGAHIKRSSLDRLTGHREDASELAAVLAKVGAQPGGTPVVVTRHYMAAGLDSFYLPDHPVIRTAGVYLGKRSTTFDQWDDTRLDNPALFGRTLLLVNEGDVPWEKALKFDRIEPIRNEKPAGIKYFLAYNYQGPQADHPRFLSGPE
jgi:hypothetical protein